MDINELKTKRIGLVLSGGGAKGAYQVGMFRALEELGLAGSITTMSGTSIGAYAELIYALKGADEYRHFLFDFPTLIADGTVLSQELVDAAKAEVSTGAITKERFCSERGFYRFEAKGLREYFENLLAENPMSTCSIPLTACCYSIEEERPEYFRLNGLTVNDCISAVIGSAGLPYLFAPVKIGTSHYLDGGVIPDICKAPQPADKIPLRAMLGEQVDAIIVNYLIPSDNADRTGFPPDLPIIEIRPSAPLEDRPGSGTSDFSPASLEWREKLGYEDTMNLFKGGRGMNTKPEFVPLTAGETGAIIHMSELATGIVREHFDPIIGKAQNDYMLGKFQTAAAITGQLEHGYIYYFVRKNGEDIGYFAYYPRKDAMYLSKFYLLKSERGKGYSRLMLDYVTEQAKAAGLKGIELNVNRNNPVCEIYDKLGFKVIRCEKNDIGCGFFMDDYVYRLEL